MVGTIFGADQVNPHDVLAINAASAALMLSGIPFDGPIGAVRIAYSDRRDLDPACHLSGGRRVHLRAGGGGPGALRGPRRRDRHHDGRGRRDRALVRVLRRGRAEGHRGGPGRRTRGGQDLDPRVDQPPARAGGEPSRGRTGSDRDHRVPAPSATTARTSGPRVEALGDRPARRGEHGHGEGGAQQGHRRRDRPGVRSAAPRSSRAARPR